MWIISQVKTTSLNKIKYSSCSMCSWIMILNHDNSQGKISTFLIHLIAGGKKWRQWQNKSLWISVVYICLKIKIIWRVRCCCLTPIPGATLRLRSEMIHKLYISQPWVSISSIKNLSKESGIGWERTMCVGFSRINTTLVGRWSGLGIAHFIFDNDAQENAAQNPLTKSL